MLPTLNAEQVAELIRESQGCAVSYVDAPEWYCGERHSTCMARDGMTASAIGDPGTCHSLAYTFRDRIVEYQRCREGAAFNRRMVESLQAEIDAEYRRKKPRKRHLANLEHEFRIAANDADRSEKRAAELVAKYFRGFEKRLLIVD